MVDYMGRVIKREYSGIAIMVDYKGRAIKREY